MKKKISLKNILIDKRMFLLYSFITASLIMLMIFLINKMNAKDYLVIRSDFLDIISFIKDSILDIKSGESALFDFSIGLGTNNSLSIAISLLSPFNILYFIFINSNLNIVTMAIIILKVGCMAATFEYFAQKVLNNHSPFGIIVSVFYALNAYVIVYGTVQIAWLDSLLILPLVICGIVDCIEKDKRILLVVSYTYLFVTQFYIGYVVGIYSFIFTVLFLVILYEKKTDHKVKESFSKFLNYFLSVVISIMISAVVWVPTLFFVAANRVPDSTDIINFDTSPLQIINSLFWGVHNGIDGKYSNIYTGIFVLVLAILFFFNKRIEKKEKWFYTGLLLVLFISMISFRLNTVWHVFDQPDSFWYRYSFLVCFTLCAMAARNLKDFSFENSKVYLWITLSVSVFYLFILHTVSLWNLDGTTYILNSNFGFIVNLSLLVIWCLILLFYFNKNKLKTICLILSFFVLSVELISNSKRQMQFRVEAESYYNWYNYMTETVRNVSLTDNGFYRMIIHKNDNVGHYTTDTLFGYNGLGDFSDQEKYSVRRFLSNIGFATSPRASFETGYNPVSEMILGVKYGINCPDFFAEEVEYPENQIDANEYYLSIGYIVDGGTILFEYPGRDVFENMNHLVNTFTGNEKDCFIRVSEDSIQYNSEDMDFYPIDGGGYYMKRKEQVGTLDMEIECDKGDVYVQFQNEDSSLYDIDFYVSESDNNTYGPVQRLSTGYAIKVPKEEKVYKLEVVSDSITSPDEFICDDINVYYLDEDALKEQYELLSKNQLTVTEYDNDYIKGNVHVDDNRLLFTTIPYDPGWKAFVNGQETEIVRLVDGTFCAIYLPGAGDYDVTFEYEVPGMRIGFIVSVCGLLAFLSVVFEKKLKKKK